MSVEILTGDVRDVLATLPAESVRTCVTSPPYWFVRDYGLAGQIGLEATPSAYVSAIVDAMAGVRRVLTEDGTLWLNLGDTYNNRSVARPSSHQGGLGHDNIGTRTSWAEHTRAGRTRLSTRDLGLKEKDLVGIPWRVAFALQDAGWWLRSDVVWSKLSGLPDPTRDRPRRLHEYVFLLSKSKSYHYSADPMGTVWDLPISGGVKGHSATYHTALAERCVLATSEPGDVVLDPFAGSGTTGVVAARHGRSFVGIDLSPDYAAEARIRIAEESARLTLTSAQINPSDGGS